MRFLSLALGGLLAATLPAHAQTTPAETPAAPRFYVGLAAYSSYYQQYRPTGVSATGFRLPVQLTAGYQLRPRLALQLGLAYNGYTSHYLYEGYYYSGATGYYREEGTTTIRNVSASALARYTLTRNPAHRMQFDALGGLTLVHRSGYYRGTTTDSLAGGGLQPEPFSARGSSTALLLTAGLSARYRLSSRFDLNLDYTLNRDLAHPQTTDFGGLGLTGSAALGVRYRFGKR